MNNKTDKLARTSAKRAHTLLFHHRRGFLTLGGRDLIVIYDNNPYVDDAMSRHQELERLKAAVTAGGEVNFCTEASYPVGGPDDGYTVALVFRAEDRDAAKEWIAQAWQRVLLTTRSDAD